MRVSLATAALLFDASCLTAAPLTMADRDAVARIPGKLTSGWVHASRSEVMSLFAPDAVFIPHDGVRPHIGKAAIEQFWFPKGAAAGKVTRFLMSADGVSGEGDQAVVWGKSDLHWQNGKAAYHWPGYYLISARRKHGKWLVTHLMSSDEQPTKEALQMP